MESQHERADIGLGSTLAYALAHPAEIVKDLFVGLCEWFIGSQTAEVAGPSELGRMASKSSSAGACLGLFAVMLAYLWPGVWLLEATFWWATRMHSVMSPSVKLATRRRRLVAAVIDASLLAAIALIGGVVAIPLSRRDSSPTASALLVALAWLTVQWLLIWRTGQSLGKRWAKIRIVREDGSRARFARIILVRSWVVPLVGFLGPLGGVILFSDPLAIWRRDRRCIHDIWAGTVVIDA